MKSKAITSRIRNSILVIGILTATTFSACADAAKGDDLEQRLATLEQRIEQLSTEQRQIESLVSSVRRAAAGVKRPVALDRLPEQATFWERYRERKSRDSH